MSIETGANRDAVVDLATKMGARTIVEIGVRRGRLSVLLAKVPTLDHLYLIDVWLPEKATTQNQHKNARSVKRWARRNERVTVLHMRSANAVSEFVDEQIDFLHIDGDHSLAGVEADIRGYLPKIRKGGIISGDDYNLLPVSRAVDELLPNRQLLPGTRLWWSFV